MVKHNLPDRNHQFFMRAQSVVECVNHASHFTIWGIHYYLKENEGKSHQKSIHYNVNIFDVESETFPNIKTVNSLIMDKKTVEFAK